MTNEQKKRIAEEFDEKFDGYIINDGINEPYIVLNNENSDRGYSLDCLESEIKFFFFSIIDKVLAESIVPARKRGGNEAESDIELTKK